jgi:hypothetical protein
MSELLDLWHSVLAIVTSGDYVTLAIMVVIALAAGFAMQNFGSIVTATFAALVLFALASYVRAVAMGGKGVSASGLAESDWHNMLGLTVHSVLAYAIAFAIVIGVVHIIRQVATR